MLVGPSRSFCHLRPILHRRNIRSRHLSSWIPAKKRSHIARRRPLVNGQIVPFHVSELCQQQPKFINIPASQAEACRSYGSDLVVVLDMDECLLHAQFSNGLEESLAYQQKPNQDDTLTSASPVDSFTIQLPISSSNVVAHVNLRPGVLGFLRKITESYETHIFTAATSVYANAVLDHISATVSPSRSDIFSSRWYRQHCTWDEHHQVFVKDLSKLPLELHKTVLVDNNPLSFLSQPDNGIWVDNFYADGNDKTLDTVLQLIRDDLHDVDDVRPVLAERFQLAQQLSVLVNTSNGVSPQAQQQQPMKVSAVSS